MGRVQHEFMGWLITPNCFSLVVLLAVFFLRNQERGCCFFLTDGFSYIRVFAVGFRDGLWRFYASCDCPQINFEKPRDPWLAGGVGNRLGCTVYLVLQGAWRGGERFFVFRCVPL